MILKGQNAGLNGLYIMNDAWTNYKVDVVASRMSGIDGFYVGAGLTNISPDKKDVLEYAIGYSGSATGVKVFKQGIQGYTLGDYSSSTAGGNLRAASYEELADNTEYIITVNYGGANGDNLICYYTDGKNTSRVLDYKLEAYNNEIFNSVTKDDKHVYVKLVNADNVEKTVNIDLKGLNVAVSGKMITLTGDSSLVHVPNVNKKYDEKIKPAEADIALDNNSATVTLASDSVNVLVLDI